jgi:hypothetical protein
VRRAAALSLTLMWLAASAPVLHPHRGDAVALYDEHCPLSQLAATCNEVNVAPVVDLVQPSPAVDLVLPPTSRGCSRTFILPVKPRGPPIAG